jgi:hypothetical protein
MKISLKRLSFIIIVALLGNQVIPVIFRSLITSPIRLNLGSFFGSLWMGGCYMICIACRPITCMSSYDYTLTKTAIPVIYTALDFFLMMGVAVVFLFLYDAQHK